MADRQELLKRFLQPEDKLLLAKVLDQADLCLRYGEAKYTDFLERSKSLDIISILNLYNDLNILSFGGGDDLERVIIGIAPPYLEINKEDFPIKLIKIELDLRFSNNLSHRDYLGSLMGLGIERDKIGDIFITDFGGVLASKNDVSDYIINNLERVSRLKAKTSYIENGLDFIPKPNIREFYKTVQSIRLDSIVSAGFSISRAKAKSLIEGEYVKINQRPNYSAKAYVNIGDIISVRGFGRVTLLDIKGSTKKDRIGVTLGLYE